MNISFLSELSTGIVILDDSLEIIFINASALSILDTTEKNSIGSTIDQIFYEKPESINDFVGALELNRNFTKTDTVLNLKKGKKVFCTYTVHSIENNNEKGLMLEIIDKESSSELIERYRMKTNQQISQDFVRGLAHEIKNPLTPIQLSIDRIKEKYLWSNVKLNLPVHIKLSFRMEDFGTEFIPCWTYNKKRWIDREYKDVDALSWYISDFKEEFAFRTKLFRSFPIN